MRFLVFICVLLSATIVFAAPQKGAVIKKDTPIEIESDSLEVQQQKSRAIFLGKVVAVQGPMTLKSQKMIVHYAQGGEEQSIKRIEVFNDVHLNRPGETATGDRGVYNVKKDTLEITGNVVLKQGDHVVSGEHFVHTPSTGFSQMLASKKPKASTPATSTTKKGRVRGVFMPNKNGQ